VNNKGKPKHSQVWQFGHTGWRMVISESYTSIYYSYTLSYTLYFDRMECNLYW